MTGGASDSELEITFEDLQTQHQTLRRLQFEGMLAVRNILTPEQRQQLPQTVGRRRDRQFNLNRNGPKLQERSNLHDRLRKR